MEIECFPIAKTAINDLESWLSHIGATPFQRSDTEAESVIGVAAKRCYMSFKPGLNPNVTKVREDWKDYLDNILKSRHGSVLEHVTYTWAIEGCTRVFTGEMNRHRAGVAISEGSMRYIRFDGSIPFWMPLSIRGGDDKSIHARMIFDEVFEFIYNKYHQLCALYNVDSLPFDEKKKLTSMFRRIVPMGVSTGAIYTFNVRALRHIIELRTSPAAEEEIAYVVGIIASHMIENECKLFGDFTCVNGQMIPTWSKV